ADGFGYGVSRPREPQDDVGKQPVGALDLRRGELRGARGVAADGIEVGDERLDLALELVGDLAQAPRRAPGGDDDRNLGDRDGERRHRDDAEEDVTPHDHALSRRACWYASRPRSIAVASVSRPWLRTSRPRAAASAARARASPAFSPRYSRVSRPLAGAYSSATAAPLTAPRMNANRMLPAPAPLSCDIQPPSARLKPRAPLRPQSPSPRVPSPRQFFRLEDAHFHVEVFLRLFFDLLEEAAELGHRPIHVLI